jgi:hypothetical protein
VQGRQILILGLKCLHFWGHFLCFTQILPDTAPPRLANLKLCRILFNPIAPDLVDSNIAVVRKAPDANYANGAASQRMSQPPQQKILRDLLRHSYLI